MLMAFEPLAGWRHVSVSKHRRKSEFAEFMRYLAEGRGSLPGYR